MNFVLVFLKFCSENSSAFSHFVKHEYRSAVSHRKPSFSWTFCDGCGAEGSDENEIICIVRNHAMSNSYEE